MKAAPTLRRRLVVWMALGALLASIPIAAIHYAVTKSQYRAFFEQGLRDDLRAIANVTKVFPHDDLYVDIEPEALPQYLADGDRYFQVWTAHDKQLVDRSQSLERIGVALPHPGTVVQTPRRYEGRLPDGRTVSLVAMKARANWGLDSALLERTGLTIEDRDVDIVVGRPRDSLDMAMLELLLSCVAGVLLTSLALGSLAAIAVPRVLRPLADLGRRGGGDATGVVPAEVQPLVEAMESLRARMHEDTARHLAFRADLVREVSEGLSHVRAAADIALLAPDEDPQQALATIRSATQRMEGLITVLTTHAGGPGEHAACAVKPLIDDAIRACGPLVRRRPQRISCDVSDAARMAIHPALLRCALDDMLDLFIEASTTDCTIRVSWCEDPDSPPAIVFRAPLRIDRADRVPHAGRLKVASAVALRVGGRVESQVNNGELTSRFGLPSENSGGETLQLADADRVAAGSLRGVERLIGCVQQ